MNLYEACRDEHLTFLLLFVAIVLFGSPSLAEWVTVERVIDGDTFVTSDGTHVRVKNLDTPETKHPTKGREPGGEAATQRAKYLLEGRQVWLEGNSKDKYGRRAAKVTLPGGSSFADTMRASGYDKSISNLSAYSAPSIPTFTAPRIRSSGSSTTWVNGHFRKDGTWVSGHYRNSSSRPSRSSSSWGLPSYGGGSGSTVVNGYFRKGGTYVSPHYRRK